MLTGLPWKAGDSIIKQLTAIKDKPTAYVTPLLCVWEMKPSSGSRAGMRGHPELKHRSTSLLLLWSGAGSAEGKSLPSLFASRIYRVTGNRESFSFSQLTP